MIMFGGWDTYIDGVQWVGHTLIMLSGWDTYIDGVQWVGHIHIEWTYIDNLQCHNNYSNDKVGSTHGL